MPEHTKRAHFSKNVIYGNTVFYLQIYYSELYNRVSDILLQNGDWTQNEWYLFCRDEEWTPL
ncbi:hypothetical protein B2G51_17085 [Leptospira santarosai]|nr:hypothetical protein B2G51_17085 [Leptospira santarosai]ONF89221.1 hypothetical protein BWD13_02235 [Leptospira santarosai serovar Grippotyphosa]